MAASAARYAKGRGPAGSWGRELRYLLSGLARCGVCGASIEARSGNHGTGARRVRVVHYACSAYQRKGTTVCTNALRVRMETADAAILDTLRRQILNPRVIEPAVRRAVQRLAAEEASDADRALLQARAEADARMKRKASP